jgi:phage gpG-like protein
MKTYNPLEFSVKLQEMVFAYPLKMRAALIVCAKAVQKTAKAEFGVYQRAVGPYPAWPELAEITKRERAAEGFPENEPLLKTGALRDSIEYKVGNFEAFIGSKSEIMLDHEFGRSPNAFGAVTPPRPVLGPAGFRNKMLIKKTLGIALVNVIVRKNIAESDMRYLAGTSEDV